MNLLIRQWFLFALAAAIITGYAAPFLGEVLNRFVPWLVALIMFLMGTGQDLAELSRSARKIPAIALTLANNFLSMPLLCLVAGYLIFPDASVLFAGMMILGSAPTTTASSIVWTRLSQGNASLSLVLTVCSTLSSVVAIPLILELSLGRTTELPTASILASLSLVIVLPVVLAQLARRVFPRTRELDRFSPRLGHAIILLIVLTAVARSSAQLSLSLVAWLTLAVAALNGLISAVAWVSGRGLGLTRVDAIAVLFASSQKALTIGLMVGLLYFPPLAALPLLIYHIFQQLSALALSRRLQPDSAAQS